ncbi:hypothetical protein [Roseateles sp. LYH14W]|uniref:Uncharacterized protein n=1 Tax=Pelomonas parva TaxID=3299032 RepID=A0ABW7FF80_9BURK
MNARTARLALPATFTPPLWLVAAFAAALAVLLLSVFVDTLYENIRRGDALRQAQAQAQAVRGGAADMVMARSAQVPRLR